MSFQIVNADIATLAVDAIVNPTDHIYSGSGGTDLAVHSAAGEELDKACHDLPRLQTGGAEITGGYRLPGRYIIHTVGPVWQDGEHNEPILLRSCYLNALLAAKRLGLQSIAFPLISSGTFGFPKESVLEIAIAAIRDFHEVIGGDMDVTLCVFDRTAYELSCKYDLEEFLRHAHKPTQPDKPSDLENWLQQQDDTFAVTLLKLIDKKGMTDVQCYKKAQVTKKTFWKINNLAGYHPAKPTAVALAIALELTLQETEQFLKTAGYSLSHSSTFDMIIEYYISRGIYDLFEINAALYRYDQSCLGC